MMSSLFPLLLLLGLSPTGAALPEIGIIPEGAWARAQVRGGEQAPEQSGGGGPTLSTLRGRDPRTSFTARSAERARALLALDTAAREVPEEDGRTRFALLALGAGGGPGDVRLLESFATAGKLADRRAAILALGECDETGLGALRRCAEHPLPGLEGALLVAFARASERGVGGADAAFAAFVAGLQGPYGESVRAAGPSENPGGLPDSITEIKTYLELRWEAAREFGLIDGRRWRDHLLEARRSDPVFLDAFVLWASARSASVENIDAVREIVRGDPRPAVLQPAIELHPEALRRLIEEEGWIPDRGAWAALLGGVPSRRVRGERDALLAVLGEAVRARSAASERAALLLVRQGERPSKAWMAKAMRRYDPAAWGALFRAAGDLRDSGLQGPVWEMLTKIQASQKNSSTALAGWVALLRMGDARAVEHVAQLLDGGPSPERIALLTSLGQVADGRDVLRLLKGVARREDLSDAERRVLALGFAHAGLAPDHAILRELLAQRELPREPWMDVVRALGAAAEPEDLVALRAVFPDDRNPSHDPLVAAVLFWNRDPEGLAMLRAALFGDGYGAGLLAGGLLLESSGVRGSLSELLSAPRTNPSISRRVGFSVGRFGGFPLVDRLAEETDERDPLLQGALLGALARRAAETEAE